ncbi:MAG: hypothetical protein OXC71_04620 [Chloroflexi bacterium]|nr:hypothetical protein [Chloroflexota bacterium]
MAENFVAKSRINAAAALAITRGVAWDTDTSTDWHDQFLPIQPAYQLIVEGLELLLKAMCLRRNKKPSAKHKLADLYMELPEGDKSVVDVVVRDAIQQSASGQVPLGLPNVAAVVLLKNFVLGVDQAEADHTRGFAGMDAPSFFRMLDAEWGTDNSQYVGVTSAFSIKKQTLRINTRVLAGAILACQDLADRISGLET